MYLLLTLSKKYYQSMGISLALVIGLLSHPGQAMEQPEREVVPCFFNGSMRDVDLLILSSLPFETVVLSGSVSKSWYYFTQQDALYHLLGHKFAGDYGDSPITKELFKLHYLKMRVNTLTDLAEIEQMIEKYSLFKHPVQVIEYKVIFADLLPCMDYWNPGAKKSMKDHFIVRKNKTLLESKFESELSNNIEKARLLNEQLAQQGDQKAIESKFNGLLYGNHLYKKDPAKAIEFNEWLVSQGNTQALDRKWEGLSRGSHGYPKAPEKAVALNEELVSKGDIRALKRKMYGLASGLYGYDKDSEQAVTINEDLISKGDTEAIERKFRGLCYGGHGYTKNEEQAVAFNEDFVSKGDIEAIKRKFLALIHGAEGYEEDPLQAITFLKQFGTKTQESLIKEFDSQLSSRNYDHRYDHGQYVIFNDYLVDQGHEEALRRKCIGLAWAKYNYITPDKLVFFPEYLEKYGYEEALRRKSEGSCWQYAHTTREKTWASGEYGFYMGDPGLAIDLIENLIQQGNEIALKIKLDGLEKGEYGYKKDWEQLSSLTDQLILQGNDHAIYRKWLGLQYGGYGYQKSSDQWLFFNEQLASKGYWRAIGAKMEGKSEDVHSYIDQLIADKNTSPRARQMVISRKIEGLSEGRHGYGENPKMALELFEKLDNKDDELMIRQKVKLLVKLNDIQGAVQLIYQLFQDGKESNLLLQLSQLRNNCIWWGDPHYLPVQWLINTLADGGNRQAQYLKSFGLKYGLFKFTIDEEAARTYIQEHFIAY